MHNLSSPVNHNTSLSPLPLVLFRGLAVMTIFGLLSCISATILFLRLAWKLVTWKRHTRVNQFVILIFNLLLADIHQAAGFLLNIEWLLSNGIIVESHVCPAQGWFLGAGDLGIGLFTLAIAIHAFVDIVFDYRLGHGSFLVAIAVLWTMNYTFATVGLALHSRDIYARAGGWCWINAKYEDFRLWLHYVWIICAVFGTVLLYGVMFLVLRLRVASNFYSTLDAQIRAQAVAKTLICYPMIYVLATLPITVVRLSSMNGADPTFLELVVAADMIACNGWLDALLYTITRRSLAFGDELVTEHHTILDTFRWRPDDDKYGTITTIESVSMARGTDRNRLGSTEELVEAGRVRVMRDVDVQVCNEEIEMPPYTATTNSTSGPVSCEIEVKNVIN